MEDFRQFFKGVKDPRTSNATRHDFLEMPAVALLSSLCGGRTCVDMADFAVLNEKFLRRFMRPEHGPPSRDAFSRLFRMMEPGPFAAALSRFASGWAKALEADGVRQIAVDGKALRRTFSRASELSPLHLLSAFAPGAGIALGQVAVDRKSNEVRALCSSVPLVLQFRSGMSRLGFGFDAPRAKLDAELGKFAERRLEGSFPYLILDARYEKVREDGVVRDRAVLIAVGVDAAGRRQVLGVELAEGESRASWRRFLESLRDRGLCGVVQVVSDDHSGLTKAIREVVPEAVRQRCYVHFLRNARAHLNRRSGDGCLRELRWIYDRPSVEEARRDLAAWLEKWQASQPKLCDWVEATIEETFAFLRLPRQHHLRMRSTNMLERSDEEIKRRTKVVRIFPDARSCLRLVRALCAETHESWMEDGGRCPDMDLLQEQRRADLRKLAA